MLQSLIRPDSSQKPTKNDSMDLDLNAFLGGGSSSVKKKVPSKSSEPIKKEVSSNMDISREAEEEARRNALKKKAYFAKIEEKERNKTKSVQKLAKEFNSLNSSKPTMKSAPKPSSRPSAKTSKELSEVAEFERKLMKKSTPDSKNIRLNTDKRKMLEASRNFNEYMDNPKVIPAASKGKDLATVRFEQTSRNAYSRTEPTTMVSRVSEGSSIKSKPGKVRVNPFANELISDRGIYDGGSIKKKITSSTSSNNKPPVKSSTSNGHSLPSKSKPVPKSEPVRKDVMTLQEKLKVKSRVEEKPRVLTEDERIKKMVDEEVRKRLAALKVKDTSSQNKSKPDLSKTGKSGKSESYDPLSIGSGKKEQSKEDIIKARARERREREEKERRRREKEKRRELRELEEEVAEEYDPLKAYAKESDDPNVNKRRQALGGLLQKKVEGTKKKTTRIMYDSDADSYESSFIDDKEEDPRMKKFVGKMFSGYREKIQKYSDDDDDLEGMEAGFEDILEEEEYTAKVGELEDKREYKKILEEAEEEEKEIISKLKKMKK